MEAAMTPDEFRRVALGMPEAVEGAHMGHPDFRAGGRIFATLAYPNDERGMVKLTPEQQNDLVRAEPEMFVPVRGAWGLKGCTGVRLAKTTVAALRPAMKMAWENARSQPARAARPKARRAAPARATRPKPL
jgi:hypothetical protein